MDDRGNFILVGEGEGPKEPGEVVHQDKHVFFAVEGESGVGVEVCMHEVQRACGNFEGAREGETGEMCFCAARTRILLVGWGNV